MKTKRKKKIDAIHLQNYDFVGICCHKKDFSLAWSLNKIFSFDFKKEDNFTLDNNSEEKRFSLYFYESELLKMKFYLIKNKNFNEILIPNLKSFDFLFVIFNELGNAINTDDYVRKIVKIPEVITAVKIELIKTNIEDMILLSSELELYINNNE